jgi:uncharacterized protein
MKRLITTWSPVLTVLLALLTLVGAYLGSGITLKLSLTDLLPENHPAVVKFEKLTEVVGGVGYFTIVLSAEDGKSHLATADAIIEGLKPNPLVRNAFYHREQSFFIKRLLYYVEIPELQKLEKNIGKQILQARQSAFDLGLFEEEKAEEKKPVFDSELKDRAQKSAGISPYLISKDKKHLLIMVKPSFDSMDLKKTQELVDFSTALLQAKLPAGVGFRFAERYYSKIVETKMIQTDIFVLGTLSILLIAGIIFLYLRSFRALLMIFLPVFMGMGITIGITKLAIGHINIITGFLMGIVSGLGVDYAIHLLLRLRLESEQPSNADADPIWRTLASSGHAVFVGAAAASGSFFLLCFSSFRAFSEFGFICGAGIACVFVCLLGTFSTFAKLLKLNKGEFHKKPLLWTPPLPVLSVPKGLIGGLVTTGLLMVLALNVGFEYDFDKMLQHSKEMEDLGDLVDAIYDRSNTPSALSAPTREEALAVEKLIKTKYMPNIVSEMISGASIVPDDQAQKKLILRQIQEEIGPLKDKWIEKALDIPADVVRGWAAAEPFSYADLPPHIQDALRGTQKKGYLLYLYPAIKLSDAKGVRTYAAMIKDIETQFPNLLTGSDAVIFSDILDLIGRDGLRILLVIFISVGLFIWINVRRVDDTLMSYLPLLISLPVGMGLMAIFGVKFNIFNVAIIPTFVAMGIDVPIHIVHRAREVGSGHKAARDLAMSINLALLTAAAGFGVLIFARAGVLKSLGWIALLGTVAIWWIGLIVLPAFLEQLAQRRDNRALVEE